MTARIDTLTPEQEARMDEWADRWIEIGLRTGPADRELFEDAARRCYEAAGIPWPGVVVWVDSPIVGALAAPIASHLLRADAVHGAVGGAVRDAVRNAVDGAVGGAVHGAVRNAVDGAVRDAVRDAVHGAVGGAVHGVVHDAVDGAVDGAVGGAVRDAVGDAVRDAVHGAVHGVVHDAVDGAVDGAVGGAVRDAVRDAVDGAVGGAVDGAVHGAVRDAVGGAVRDAVDGAVGGAVHDAVRNAVDGAVRGAVRDAVHGAVDGAVDGAVHGVVGDAVDGAVRDAVDGAVRGAVGGAVHGGWWRYLGGQFWAGGWWGSAYVSYFREVCGLTLAPDVGAAADAYADTCASACWWWPYRGFVLACERPLAIHRELVDTNRPRGFASHRLHCETGPAIVWPDGWGVWSVHGVRVPQQVVERPETLTPEQILGEPNAEVRRVMIERHGADRLMAHAREVDRDVDELGQPRILWHLDIPEDEPLRMVELVNSTPEPDGSYRRYHLRVPPACETALHAVAWTWGVKPQDYALEVQT